MDYLFTSNITDPAILAAEVERLRAENGRLIAEISRLTKLLDEVKAAEAELGRLREVAAALTAAADEAERYLGDVAAYERVGTNEGRVGTLLGRAIAMARGEQGP